MASVSIPDPVFHRLQSNAAARRMSLEAYLAELAGKDAPPALDHSQRLAAWDQFVGGMSKWAEVNLPAGYVADDSRESIYDGRGE